VKRSAFMEVSGLFARVLMMLLWLEVVRE
jgi:hypothetical protein